MHLGESSRFHYCPIKKRYIIDGNKEEEEEEIATFPPTKVVQKGNIIII
jgi:hypothetical protein